MNMLCVLNFWNLIKWDTSIIVGKIWNQSENVHRKYKTSIANIHLVNN